MFVVRSMTGDISFAVRDVSPICEILWLQLEGEMAGQPTESAEALDNSEGSDAAGS